MAGQDVAGCVAGPAGSIGRTPRRWRQYMAAVVVNIAGFISGTAYGWNAPIIPLLQSENSSLGIPPITEAAASWLASIISLTRIFTTPAFMYVIARYGPKITGYVIGAASILSWALLLYANSATAIFVSRIIIGVASGGIVLLVPTFTSDFAEDDIKGRLAGFFGLSMNMGATFSYAMGSYTSYSFYHISCLLVPVVFIGSFYWLPDSPLFLMAEGKAEDAKNSLRWFRNGQDCEFELQRLRIRAQDVLRKRNKKISCVGMYDKATVRGLLITVGLLTNKQMSGITVITTFNLTIFQESGSTLSPSMSTIIIGGLLIIGTLLSTVVIEKAGRRPLLLYSDIFIGVCLAALGTFVYLKNSGWDTEYLGWIPLACLSLYILGMSLALGPLTFTILTEMVSAHSKSEMLAVCTIYGALVAFASSLSFAPLVRALGQHGVFWLYSGVCFVGSVCIFLVMPETKNRSVEDVVEQLRSDHYIRSVVRGPTVSPKKSTNEAC